MLFQTTPPASSPQQWRQWFFQSGWKERLSDWMAEMIQCIPPHTAIVWQRGNSSVQPGHHPPPPFPEIKGCSSGFGSQACYIHYESILTSCPIVFPSVYVTSVPICELTKCSCDKNHLPSKKLRFHVATKWRKCPVKQIKMSILFPLQCFLFSTLMQILDQSKYHDAKFYNKCVRHREIRCPRWKASGSTFVHLWVFIGKIFNKT